MPSRCRQKIAAYLGLFAILLTVVAPTVAQTLRAQGWLDPALAAYFPVGHAHHHEPLSVPHHHAHHHHSGAEHDGSSDAGASLDACPYCALAAQIAVVASAPATPVACAPSAWLPPPPGVAPFRPYAVLTRAQPRGPPVQS